CLHGDLGLELWAVGTALVHRWMAPFRGGAPPQRLTIGAVQKSRTTTPGANPAAASLLEGLKFRPIGTTMRMYRGEAPRLSLGDVYGLACLELG
ncbi:MAG: GNAT family N-acetyltransferase, partial [Synechococcaceae cyanobacterium]